MAILEILNGAAAGQRYELASGQTVLGRDPFCDVILPLRSISRQHARILAERGQFYIEDLHSLNGTFVNGQRVAARSRLKDHDRIVLYETQITFYETRPEPVDRFGRRDAPWRRSRAGEWPGRQCHRCALPPLRLLARPAWPGDPERAGASVATKARQTGTIRSG